jgi:hypothetical protein
MGASASLVLCADDFRSGAADTCGDMKNKSAFSIGSSDELERIVVGKRLEV